MNFYSASQIHNGRQWLPAGSVIEADGRGLILAIHDPGTIAPEFIRHYEGILCPGFINAHCHLELSHMKGAIEEGGQLVPFLQKVIQKRNHYSAEQKDIAIKKAMDAVKKNGIVAVGDIANGTDSLEYRTDAGFHIHTFIECLGFSEDNAAGHLSYSEKVYDQFAKQEGNNHLLRQSIVPHAPYSVSGSLFRLISEFDRHALLSVHNQETLAENEFYETKTGDLFDLYKFLQIDPSFFKASGKTSLQTYLPQLDKAHPVILVHNTYTAQEDINFLKHGGFEFYLCLCPNANIYIERTLPPVDLFIANNLPVCLGTDSLASNHELSIWAEVQTIRKHFPHIDLETLLVWATRNGARALQMEDRLGSLEKGKQPGIIHITAQNQIEVVI